MLFRARTPRFLPRRWAGRARGQPPVPKHSTVQVAWMAVEDPVGVSRGKRRGTRCRCSGEETKRVQFVYAACHRACLEQHTCYLPSAYPHFSRLILASGLRVSRSVAGPPSRLPRGLSCGQLVFLSFSVCAYMVLRPSTQPRQLCGGAQQAKAQARTSPGILPISEVF